MPDTLLPQRRGSLEGMRAAAAVTHAKATPETCRTRCVRHVSHMQCCACARPRLCLTHSMQEPLKVGHAIWYVPVHDRTHWAGGSRCSLLLQQSFLRGSVESSHSLASLIPLSGAKAALAPTSNDNSDTCCSFAGAADTSTALRPVFNCLWWPPALPNKRVSRIMQSVLR